MGDTVKDLLVSLFVACCAMAVGVLLLDLVGRLR